MTDTLMETIRLFESRPEKIYHPGEVIFQEGDEQSCMYGVIEGEVESRLGDKVIEILKPGELFGVGAIVHEDHRRASSAIAKTRCRLAELDREHFLFAVQQTPMFALGVMRTYSDRCRRLKKIYKQAIGN